MIFIYILFCYSCCLFNRPLGGDEDLIITLTVTVMTTRSSKTVVKGERKKEMRHAYERMCMKENRKRGKGFSEDIIATSFWSRATHVVPNHEFIRLG